MLLLLTVLLVSMSRELVVNSLTQLLVTTKLLPTLTTLVIDGTFLVGVHLVVGLDRPPGVHVKGVSCELSDTVVSNNKVATTTDHSRY